MIDGYNVVLQALPIPDRDGNCKIVLRPPKESDKDQADRDRQTLRDENDRRRNAKRDR